MDNLHGFAFGWDFLTTSDSGESWERISKSIKDDIAKIDFVSKKTGWALSYYSLYKTSDAGYTWQSQFSFDGVGNWDMGLEMLDSLNGVLAYGYGGISLTSDGGENWENQSLSRGIHFLDVQMVGTDILGRYRIFLTGDEGRVAKYVPGVMPYENHYPTYTMAKINSISLFMEDRLPYLWFAGERFTILKGNTELVVNVEEIENDFITSFKLHQNYPNPFNPATAIKYEVPERCNVSLKVYDVLGSEVVNLIDEEKDAGIYEVEFDAKNLASGIYLYKLQAGKFVKT